MGKSVKHVCFSICMFELCHTSALFCFLNNLLLLEYQLTYWKQAVTFKMEMPKSSETPRTQDLPDTNYFCVCV